MRSRAFRRLASWIALVAIAAMTLMPTFARASAAAEFGVDVCSADFPRGRAPVDAGHALDHCPYCALSAHLAPPPAPRVDGALAPVAFRPLPPAFLRAPRATGIWTSAQPRAPPFAA